MKDRISALMDGELPPAETEDQLHALRKGGVALETWQCYHLIGDAIRDTRPLSNGFSARFSERLALEATILAPSSIPRQPEKHRAWIPLSVAAGLAAVALVGALAYQSFGPESQQIAQKTPERPKPVAMARVPMTWAVNDYLLAHQNYSPRSTLQGVAPYVRTVSESSRPR